MADFKRPKWEEPEFEAWDDDGSAAEYDDYDRDYDGGERQVVVGVGAGFGCFPRQSCYLRPCFPI